MYVRKYATTVSTLHTYTVAVCVRRLVLDVLDAIALRMIASTYNQHTHTHEHTPRAFILCFTILSDQLNSHRNVIE